MKGELELIADEHLRLHSNALTSMLHRYFPNTSGINIDGILQEGRSAIKLSRGESIGDLKVILCYDIEGKPKQSEIGDGRISPGRESSVYLYNNLETGRTGDTQLFSKIETIMGEIGFTVYS
jgi:hypothetical protein